jgi:murein DD-endopeptidase MepM/ murein hydrolase activator NlpD
MSGTRYNVSVIRGICVAGLVTLSFCSMTGAAESIRLTVDARSFQPGELMLLTLKTIGEADAVKVHVFERDAPAFKIDATTWRALVGIDLDTATGRHPISIDARSGTRVAHSDSSVVVDSRSFPTRRLKVDPSFVTPSAELQKRIAREAQELSRLWSMSPPTRLWNGPFVRPVPGGSVSAFGTRSVFNGQPRSPHSGGDFQSPVGTQVAAPNAGLVVMAREQYFLGNVVVVDHGLGLFSVLAHLSEIDVREGDSVASGQMIGRVGATGRVTGPHLHWAVRAGGARIDPLSLLAMLGSDSTAASTR